jgi:hypothetical protein
MLGSNNAAVVLSTGKEVGEHVRTYRPTNAVLVMQMPVKVKDTT